MKIGKLFLTTISLAIIVAQPAWSFDRIACDSSLNGWEVSPDFNGSVPFMNSEQSSGIWDKSVSTMLLLKDEYGSPIALVTPWYGIVLTKSEPAKTKGYKFNFQTDKEAYFSLEVTAPKSTTKHQFTCRLTF